jgi:predicted nucleic acid-binding Zn ribbon protein
MAHEWPKVVGEKISAVSRPVSIDRGRLLIWVKSSTWAHELTYIQADLVQKINDWKGGSWVHTIVFTQDRNAAIPTSPPTT